MELIILLILFIAWLIALNLAVKPANKTVVRIDLNGRVIDANQDHLTKLKEGE